MAYLLNLFTPQTWRAFREHGSDVTGFSRAHRSRANNLARIKPGDFFVCYLAGLSRWCGILENEEGPYEDETPIFEERNDPWVIRFKVKPLIQLDFENALPIRAEKIWQGLERTRNIQPGSVGWGVRAGLQSSLVSISDADGKFLYELLREQETQPVPYPLDDNDRKLIAASRDIVRTNTGSVTVVIPEGDAASSVGPTSLVAEPELRESILMQAQLVEIGSKMGFQAWVPRSDRARVVEHLSADAKNSLISVQLPLNYNDATLKTIENIDVLWMKNRSIVRAFEVEHTTAIYSGLLRMADLLALQPNIDIKLHIVAPDIRREKVLDEIKRPVFAYLEKGPLSDSCSFLSYTAIQTLHEEPNLPHLRDSYIGKFEEFAENA